MRRRLGSSLQDLVEAGLSAAEIALHLDRTCGAVRSRLRQGTLGTRPYSNQVDSRTDQHALLHLLQTEHSVATKKNPVLNKGHENILIYSNISKMLALSQPEKGLQRIAPPMRNNDNV